MSTHLESTDANAQPFPERLGRYRLIRCVSTGGMARVYEGRRESLAGVAPRVAIKVILPEHANDAKFQQLFVNEARIGSQLQHQNVVQIQDFDRQGDCYYLVMEYVEGLTFRRAISHCKRSGLHIPLAVIAELGRQMCEGLHYAHTARAEDGSPLHLVHRDIKPSNLILNPQGLVKILDFGISKALIASESRGTVKGTWGYMSPEQADGGEVSGRADQYGVAAVLYELAMLQPLFPEKEPRILRTLMVQDEGARRANRLTAAYGPLAPVLVRALQRDAYGRYPTCMAMAQDLSRLVPDPVLAREQVLQFQSSILALDRLRKERRGRNVAAVVMNPAAQGAQAVSLQPERSSEVSGLEEISDVAEAMSPSNQPSLANQAISIHHGPVPRLAPVQPSLAAPAYDPRALNVAVGNQWRPYGADEVAPGVPEDDEPDAMGTWLIFGVMMTISAAVLLFVGNRLYTERFGAAGVPEVVQDAPVGLQGAPVDAGQVGEAPADPPTGKTPVTQTPAVQTPAVQTPPDGGAGGEAQATDGSAGRRGDRRTGREDEPPDAGPDEVDPRVGAGGTPVGQGSGSPEPVVQTGTLAVSSSKAGARLYVDGGRLNSSTSTQAAGTYRVHFLDGEGNSSTAQVVTVPPGGEAAWYYDWDSKTWSRD